MALTVVDDGVVELELEELELLCKPRVCDRELGGGEDEWPPEADVTDTDVEVEDNDDED